MDDQDKVEMLLLLIQNVDVFAWNPYEVPGVDPEFIVHKLNVDPSHPPKKQRPRRSAKEHTEVVINEVRRLKESGAIRETFFPEWLANTIVVRKKNGKWRGYHQIALAPENQEQTAFISPEANYHYTVMLFGLKNAGATYQWMMTRMFRDKIGRTVEVYIDDMVIKSKQVMQHTDDLREVFETLRRHKLRLNAEKCAFGVSAGKFLGYLITSRGIEVNPDQIEAIKRLNPPSNPKEVQVLTGMLAALNRFISKLANRCRPLYQILKKWAGFLWNKECDQAFRDLKDYLVRAPMLAAPEPGEDLFMYLAVSEHASLLKRYFTGRIAKWGTRLASFDIRYRPRHSVKGQVLADFVAEFSPKSSGEMICCVEAGTWRVFVDGASSAPGAGAGIVIFSPEGIRLENSYRLGFRASNNEAEYEALLAGLRSVLKIGARNVEVFSDSRLVVNQVQGHFEARDPRMKVYLHVAKQIMGEFVTVKISQVGLVQNRHVNSLAALASSNIEDVPRMIRVELIAEPSIQVSDDIAIRVGYVTTDSPPAPCWMDPVITFLAEDRVPDDQKEVGKIRHTAARYWLSADDKLYQRSFGGPYLLCLRPEKVPEILAELHDGFDSKAFRTFCGDLGIKNRYSTPAYPQSNGLAEATNKTYHCYYIYREFEDVKVLA
nr:uncharacterized protein LOC112004688 [Quercus suber]